MNNRMKSECKDCGGELNILEDTRQKTELPKVLTAVSNEFFRGLQKLRSIYQNHILLE